MENTFLKNHMDKIMWFLIGWAVSVMFYKLI